MIQIHSIKQGASVCELSLQSGKLLSLRLRNRLIIQGDDLNPLGNGSYLMYPWVNRCTTVKTSSFTDDNGIPLHGLVANQPRAVVSSSDQSLVITPQDIDPTIPVIFEEFALPQETTLRVTASVKENPADYLYGLGYHPYFTFSDINQVELSSNLNRKLIVNDQLIPVTEQLEWEEIDLSLVDLSTAKYDNCFACSAQQDSYFFRLRDKKEGYSITIESKMPYWQVYTPPDGKRIAIEPQTSTPEQYKYNTAVAGVGSWSFEVTLKQDSF